MKLLETIILILFLNISTAHAGFDLLACCPVFCGLGPICIQEGFHNLDKANDASRARERAREASETTSSMEEGQGVSNVDDQLPHGVNFPRTYESKRRRQGYAWLTVGTIICTSVAYTTSKIAYAIYNSDKKE